MTKAIAYSAELVTAIVEKYQAGISLEDIAKETGKTVPMIRSKLVSEKVYVAQVRKSVGGASAVPKSHLVKQIAEKLDIEGIDSIEKGSKADLEVILNAINEIMGE